MCKAKSRCACGGSAVALARRTTAHGFALPFKEPGFARTLGINEII